MSVTYVFYTLTTLAKSAAEVVFGLAIKLFIENGRVSTSDIKNDYFFWLPGVTAYDGDGLSRQAVDEVENHYSLNEQEVSEHDGEIFMRNTFYFAMIFGAIFLAACFAILFQ